MKSSIPQTLLNINLFLLASRNHESLFFGPDGRERLFEKEIRYKKPLFPMGREAFLG
jgi:hypothetical protein